MKKNYLLFTLLVSILMESSAFSDVQNIEGTVHSIKPGLIMINAWGDNLQVDLEVNQGTRLQRINSLDDLTLGDHVNIYYLEEGNEKIATSIIKERPSKNEIVL